MIKMPKFLCEEMQEYLNMLYGLKKKDRIFTVTKSYLHHEMDRGVEAAGVKRIRIHDLRHSHISLLIDMGFSAVAIADRVGHESIDITYQYAHLFPSKQTEMADRLDDLGKGEDCKCQLRTGITKTDGETSQWDFGYLPKKMNASTRRLPYRGCPNRNTVTAAV